MRVRVRVAGLKVAGLRVRGPRVGGLSGAEGWLAGCQVAGQVCQEVRSCGDVVNVPAGPHPAVPMPAI